MSIDPRIQALEALADHRSRAEAAQAIGVTTRTVDRLIRTGRLAAYRSISGRVWIKTTDLNAYIAARYQQLALFDVPAQRGTS